MTSVDSNFNFLCGRPHGGWTPSPVHMRPHWHDPLPLRVDVINGWPHKLLLHVNGNCTSNTLNALGQDGRIVRTTDPSQLVHAFNAFLNWKWKDTRTKNTSGEKAVEH